MTAGAGSLLFLGLANLRVTGLGFWILDVLLLLAIVGVVIALATDDRDPSTLLAWLFVILLHPGAGPRRLLLHRAQLPPRLSTPHQDRQQAGRGGRARRWGRWWRPTRRSRRRRWPLSPVRPARASSRPDSTEGTLGAGAGRQRGRLLPAAPRSSPLCSRTWPGEAVRPPHVPHLGAGRAHRQGHGRAARAPRGRRRGAHPVRLAVLHLVQEGRAQAAGQGRRHRGALLQAPAAHQLPQPHEDGDHRRRDRSTAAA